jgi:hypothetical protein
MNLSAENQKLLRERLSNLPPNYVRFLSGNFINNLMQMLGSRYDLWEEASAAVENELVLFLLGFTPLNELQAHVQEVSGLDGEIARKIVFDIRSILPTEVISLLSEIDSIQSSNESAAAPPTPAENVQRIRAENGIPKPPLGHVSTKPRVSETTYADAPITKEELMASLNPKRTMEDDREHLERAPQRHQGEAPANIPRETASPQKEDTEQTPLENPQPKESATIPNSTSPEQPFVPRYSKPFSGPPRYGEEKDDTNPHV